MADLSPARRGEAFRFLDTDVANALLEMARAWQAGQLGNNGGRQQIERAENPISVIVQNRTGSALAQYGVVGFSDALVTFATSAAEFKRRPQFRATTPTATGPFGIVQQPLANWVSDSTPKTIGRAVVAGCTVCKLNVVDSSHTYAAPTTSTTELTTQAGAGPARILAKESGTGSGKYGLVLVTNASAAITDRSWYLSDGASLNAIGITLSGSYNVDLSGYSYLTDTAVADAFTLPSTGVWHISGHVTGLLEYSSGTTDGGMSLAAIQHTGNSSMLHPAGGAPCYIVVDASGRGPLVIGTTYFSFLIDVVTANAQAFDLWAGVRIVGGAPTSAAVMSSMSGYRANRTYPTAYGSIVHARKIG